MPRGGKREGSGRKPLTEESKKLRILDPYIDESIQTIAQIRDSSSNDKLRLEAAIWILEQYMGKAKQKTDVTKGFQSQSAHGFDVTLFKYPCLDK